MASSLQKGFSAQIALVRFFLLSTTQTAIHIVRCLFLYALPNDQNITHKYCLLSIAEIVVLL